MPPRRKNQVVKRVTFFGFSQCGEGDLNYRETYETAKLLAEHGYIIVNGGFTCTMEAGSRGAKDGGGHTIAVTYYPNGRTTFEGGERPNRWVDQEIKTKTYVERTLGLINLGDAYVAFKGGTGTMSEVAMAWALNQIYLYDFKPLILFGSFWNSVVSALDKNLLIQKTSYQTLRIVVSPREVLETIECFEETGALTRERRRV